MSRPQGRRPCCPKKPEWGLGYILADDGGAWVTVFFLGGGKRTLDDVAAKAGWHHAHCTFRPAGTRIGYRWRLAGTAGPISFRSR